jgi:hypothetical protein
MSQTAEKDFAASNLFAWGLTGCVATLAVCAILSLGGIGDADALGSVCIVAFAGVAGFALALANVSAGHLMQFAHQWKHGRYRAQAIIAGICALGFCLASLLGVEMGWQIVKSRATGWVMPPDWVVLVAASFIAFAKPAMTLLIEARRLADAERAAEDEKQIRAEAEQREARQDARSHLSIVRGIGPLAAAAALAGAGFAGPAVEPPKMEDASVAPSQSMTNVALAQAETPHWVKRKHRAKYEAFAYELAQGRNITQAARAANVADSTAWYWAGRMRSDAPQMA